MTIDKKKLEKKIKEIDKEISELKDEIAGYAEENEKIIAKANRRTGENNEEIRKRQDQVKQLEGKKDGFTDLLDMVGK